MFLCSTCTNYEFQSTPFCAKGDTSGLICCHSPANFNPRPSARRATVPRGAQRPDARYFNPRPSARRATGADMTRQYIRQFQSTPFCAKGDFALLLKITARTIFQSTPFCAKGDLLTKSPARFTSYFNPRPSARRATGLCHFDTHVNQVFQSTPFCAKSDHIKDLLYIHIEISIHALLREGRPSKADFRFTPGRFQSTPFCAKGDLQGFNNRPQNGDFNPRPSARRATILELQRKSDAGEFQSTPFCAKGDADDVFLSQAEMENFNPRPSARRATARRRLTGRVTKISIHALLREGRPSSSCAISLGSIISIHALLREGRLDCAG